MKIWLPCKLTTIQSLFGIYFVTVLFFTGMKPIPNFVIIDKQCFLVKKALYRVQFISLYMK